jgi:hypothetical protein
MKTLPRDPLRCDGTIPDLGLSCDVAGARWWCACDNGKANAVYDRRGVDHLGPVLGEGNEQEQQCVLC